MRRKLWVLLLLLYLLPLQGQQYFDVDQSVKVTASANAQSITVTWIEDPRTTGYDLFRREYGTGAGWGSKIASYPPGVTEYQDSAVTALKLYEYKVRKYTEEDVDGFGYVLSGYRYPAVHHNGDLLVVLTNSTAGEVALELDDYLNTVRTDGWRARTLLIGEEDSVSEVKAAILAAHEQDPVTALLLLDDVPIAFSGNINPDAHTDHKGAWASDVYYGDLDGVWTDFSVNNTTAATPVNHNIPGDEKWDQSFLASDLELAVGRVDFRNLPSFTDDRYELLREYLRKNIAYRNKDFTPRQRAAMRNTNPWLGALGQNGIRNFSALVSPDSIQYDTWEGVFDNSYLWYYGAGSEAVRNGQSFLYSFQEFQAVFTAWFSSYTGDYALNDNYMKAVLGSGDALTAVWAGAPHWHFHAMAMGFPMAHASKVSQNNDTIYTADYFPRGVHANLLGDPTLKSYVVSPPRDLTVEESPGIILLQWATPPETPDAYYVYRSLGSEDLFQLIDSTSASINLYRDSCPTWNTNHNYLVRAAKLETTPSGSFVNLSSGTSASLRPSINFRPVAAFSSELAEGILSLSSFSQNAETLTWLLPDGSTTSTNQLTINLPADSLLSISLIAANHCGRDTISQDFLFTATNTPPTQAVRIYPNPARETLNIESDVPIVRIRLYSAAGRMVQEYHGTTQQINLHTLQPGAYVVTLDLSDGRLIRRRLVRR